MVSDDGRRRPQLRVRQARRDLVVLLCGDEAFPTRGVPTSTLEALGVAGGPAQPGQPVCMLGLVHVRWALASSVPATSAPLSWVRQLGSCGRSLVHFTHWLDYQIVATDFLEHPLRRGDVWRGSDCLSGFRCLGEFVVWAPLARAISAGAMGHMLSIPVNDETTRRLVGAPFHRPRLRQLLPLFASVDTQSRPLAFDVAETEAAADPAAAKDLFMCPLRIIRFLISSRHLKNSGRTKEAQADCLEAAFDRPPEVETIDPPSQTFLVGQRPMLDILMMIMRRHWLRSRIRDVRRPIFWFYQADSSPASGFEALNVIENCIDGAACSHRLAPCTFLAVGQVGLRHKLFNFLWTLWLEVGPCQQIFRWKLWS